MPKILKLKFMKIILNNTPEEIEHNKITLGELIRYKNYTFRLLVTKINDQLINKEDRETTSVQEGDNVMVLHLISGG
jgi:thiamine biosynthesis protein ThiS